MSFKRNFDLNKDAKRGMIEVQREMGILGLQMVKEAGNILDKKGRNFTGDTKKNISHLVELFLQGLAAKLTVGTNSDHARVVHDGREPGKVPYTRKPRGFEADPLDWGYTFLHEWVEKKLNIASTMEIKSVAGAIAQKIKKEGTEGTPFLDMTLERFQNRFVRRVQKAYLRGFNGA